MPRHPSSVVRVLQSFTLRRCYVTRLKLAAAAHFHRQLCTAGTTGSCRLNGIPVDIKSNFCVHYTHNVTAPEKACAALAVCTEARNWAGDLQRCMHNSW
jgi:hypothetical protein